LTEDATLVYKKAKVATVQEKALQVAAKQRWGLFQSNRENDQLNAALGNPEHIECICSVGSQMSWKHSFLKDSTSYNKCDRYKKPLKRRLKRRSTRSLSIGLWHSYKILAKKVHCSIS
jgi:hypothetical protein